jgi:hypothetical protein
MKHSMTRLHPVSATGALAGVLMLAVSLSVSAQSGRGGDANPRTSWGDPDISGVYAEYTTAPLERPEQFGEREFLTDDEFEELERRRLSPVERNPDSDTEPGTAADVHYNLDQFALGANEGVSSPNRRTSIVTIPANGRIPAALPQAAERRQAATARNRGREYDGPENRSLTERCIVWSSTLPPILPGGYNSNLQIFQSPGYVMIQGEMGDPRVIPTDGRTLPENLLPQWNGTSVGRWEDDTLVVETAGFRPETAWRGSSARLHVTEKFTRVDKDTLEYAFTVVDPETWAEPWGGVYPLTAMDSVLFEYACTEGNYGMANILSGERAREREAAGEEQ